MRPIVLASTSRYRRELLGRLRLSFEVDAPQIKEAPLPAEPPRMTALRLAHDKAQAVAARHPRALVIAADQVADLDGAAVSKPGRHDAALAQLVRMQGKTVIFHTALAVLDTASGAIDVECVDTTVKYRSLRSGLLESYLIADQPYDCAGAAKVESLGIALLESVESTDPTALIGLPLIRLTSLLSRHGVVVLSA